MMTLETIELYHQKLDNLILADLSGIKWDLMKDDYDHDGVIKAACVLLEACYRVVNSQPQFSNAQEIDQFLSDNDIPNSI